MLELSRPLPQHRVFERGLRSAFTLIEMAVVLVILAALAALVAVSLGMMVDDSRDQLTQATLREVQTVILNRYVPDMGGMISESSQTLVRRGMPGPHPNHLLPAGRQEHPQLAFLYVNPFDNSTNSSFDPLVGRGWHGPYLVSSAGRYPGLDPDGNAVSRGFTAAYGIANSAPGANDGDPTVLDGWGNPIVIQETSPIEALLVSAGPDGDLLTTNDNLTLPLR